MKTTGKFWSGLLLLLAFGGWSKAQTIYAPPYQVVSTGANPVDFEFRANAIFLAKGYNGGTLLTADQGAGTRLLWFPAQGAFRAGQIYDSGNGNVAYWDSSSLGLCSVAFGADTKASGSYSSAFGNLMYSTGDSSAAFGGTGMATATASLVLGGNNYAYGNNSAVFNNYNMAYADDSTAFGYHTQSGAFASLVLGRNNPGPLITYHYGQTDGTSGAFSWSGVDPILEVGNGTSASATANAFVVYQNGQVAVQGTLTAPTLMTTVPGGDVLMFGN